MNTPEHPQASASEAELATRLANLRSGGEVETALAIFEILADSSQSPARGPAARVKLWLALVEIVDSHIDPDWSASEPPAQGVSPPPGHSGVIFPSGEVDPSSIDDAAERADYEASVIRSRQALEEFTRQGELRRIALQALQMVDVEVVNARSTGTDQAELVDAINVSGIDERRKVHFLDVLGGRRSTEEDHR